MLGVLDITVVVTLITAGFAFLGVIAAGVFQIRRAHIENKADHAATSVTLAENHHETRELLVRVDQKVEGIGERFDDHLDAHHRPPTNKPRARKK